MVEEKADGGTIAVQRPGRTRRQGLFSEVGPHFIASLVFAVAVTAGTFAFSLARAGVGGCESEAQQRVVEAERHLEAGRLDAAELLIREALGLDDRCRAAHWTSAKTHRMRARHAATQSNVARAQQENLACFSEVMKSKPLGQGLPPEAIALRDACSTMAAGGGYP